MKWTRTIHKWTRRLNLNPWTTTWITARRRSACTRPASRPSWRSARCARTVGATGTRTGHPRGSVRAPPRSPETAILLRGNRRNTRRLGSPCAPRGAPRPTARLCAGNGCRSRRVRIALLRRGASPRAPQPVEIVIKAGAGSGQSICKSKKRSWLGRAWVLSGPRLQSGWTRGGDARTLWASSAVSCLARAAG